MVSPQQGQAKQEPTLDINSDSDENYSLLQDVKYLCLQVSHS